MYFSQYPRQVKNRRNALYKINNREAEGLENASIPDYEHNLITFEIVRVTQEINARSKNRFNTKRADWEAYRTHL